ncbi:MAG TPA: hypothetical protein PLU71_05030 [Candidatus Dependentiae bacterium]|nr:hypothetical protein [Candidatus Dependentiae bacterium]HRQ63199.1 hypothetical protein [Candidatus Dependentiae bacterium]
MAQHWWWYWKIKKQHESKAVCSNRELLELDSFQMYNNYEQALGVRQSTDKCSFWIPLYELKAYLQDDDSLLVIYRDGTYTIPIERMSCNFGGYYYFFRCPKCNKRMRKLYCLKGQYQCRKCGDLCYYSQLLRPTERFSRGERKVKEYIKARGGNLEWFDKKPPRMHHKTFQKLKDRAEYYEAKSGMELFKELREWYGERAEPAIDKGFEDMWQYRIDEYKKTYKKL